MNPKVHVMGLLAFMLMLGFFATIGALMYAAYIKVAIDGTMKDVLLVMLGNMGTMATMVVSYYFGSSRGSAAKDVTIEKLQAK